MIDVKDILTTAKAAEILGVSIRTAQLWVENGQLPSWKTPGGHRRIPRQAVMDLVEHNTAKPLPSLSARAVILAGHGRSSEWHSHGLKGSGLLLDVTEDALEARKWLSHTFPMLILIENTTSGENRKLLTELHDDQRFRRTIIISSVDNAENETKTIGSNRHRLPLYPDVATTSAAVHRILTAPAKKQTNVSGYPLPWNERVRLEAVRQSGLVGSRPETSFDNLVNLAAFATRSPIAMFTLVTQTEQWFKSRTGFEGESTPREWAFCNKTLYENDLTVIEDLSKDPHFSTNPVLSEPFGFRFYAGAPVRDMLGFALGSVCVIDKIPRSLSQPEREALSTTADAASSLIRLRALEREIERHREM